MNTPTAWDDVFEAVFDAGVDHVFGLPGDDMASFLAARRRGVQFVTAADQRHATYQATAYAVLTSQPGICIVGQGPAVTHAATGLLEAAGQAAPVVLVTSGTAPDALGTGSFQEIDAAHVLDPLVRHSTRVLTARDAGPAIRRALAAARTLRGPVLLDLPADVGAASVDGSPGAAPDLDAPALVDDVRSVGPAPAEPTQAAPLELPSEMRTGRRVVVVVGGGCRHGARRGRLEALARRCGAAVVCTASGRGVVSEDDPAFLGLCGLYAPPPARDLMARADVIVALGSRLEETATFGWGDLTGPVVQVIDDPLCVDPEATSPRATHVVASGVAAFLDAWEAHLDERRPCNLDPVWAEAVAHARAQVTGDAATRQPSRIPAVLHHLDEVVPDDRVSVHENGLHDIWSYVFPYWRVPESGDVLVPSEQTPLGFGVGAVRGVVAACPSRPVVVIAGDGAVGVTLAELPALARLRAPVLLVVLRDGGYGWLDANLRAAGGHPDDSFLTTPRYLHALSDALGLAYVSCPVGGDADDAVERAWSHARGGRVTVLDVEVTSRDVPPGFESLAGEFPSAASAPVPPADDVPMPSRPVAVGGSA